MRIKKVSQTTPAQAQIVDGYSTSTTDGYSANYVNNVTQANITTDGNAVKCGYQIDGKDVYVKRIYFGALPNEASKTVATGIDFSTHTLIKIEGIAKYATNSIAIPIPSVAPATLAYTVMVNIDASSNLVVTTGSDRSAFNAWFNIYYI